MRIVVVFPAPFGPRKPKKHPCGTERVRPLTAKKIAVGFFQIDNANREFVVHLSNRLRLLNSIGIVANGGLKRCRKVTQLAKNGQLRTFKLRFRLIKS